MSAVPFRRFPKSQQLLAGFLSSWLCSFLSLTVAMLYIRFVCHISLGGREWAGVGACLMASFAASAFGTLLGALPKIPTGAKQGLCTAIACTLSLFSGLYGSFAMQLSDFDRPAHTGAESAQSGAADHEPVLRHPLLRQFQTVLHHRRHPCRDEPGLPCCGDRSVEEATL